MSEKGGRRVARPVKRFSAETFLGSAGVSKRILQYARSESIFSQGQPCDTVMYIQSGGVKLSVLSRAGKEAVVAMLGPGDFFGEACLIGQVVRIGSATAITPTTVLVITKRQLSKVLHDQHQLSDASSPTCCHVTSGSSRTSSINCSLERETARPHAPPARALRQAGQAAAGRRQDLAGDAVGDGRHDPVARELLHEQIQKARFIEYDGKLDAGIVINSSLLSVVLHTDPPLRPGASVIP